MIQLQQVKSPESGETLMGILQANDLPTSDVDPQKHHYFLAHQEGAIVGTGGLEIYADAALIRSVAIADGLKKQGLGKELTLLLEQEAHSRGVVHLFLLTTTAKAFFTRMGYATCEREAVPKAIAATAEFQSICPSTASCLHKQLT